MGKPDPKGFHPIMAPVNSSHIAIGGFEADDKSRWFCTVAIGTRYQDYGITDGSILLCDPNAPVRDGDLVSVIENHKRVLYIYKEDPSCKAEGKKRVIHDRQRIEAKVLSSFNYFG